MQYGGRGSNVMAMAAAAVAQLAETQVKVVQMATVATEMVAKAAEVLVGVEIANAKEAEAAMAL